jgi:1-acyl-sn-glycerol-3-phosphate acyltransferase
VARLAEPLATRIADHAIRAVCRLAAHRIDLRVEGLEHLPATGPALLAARHFHHFYDGCALVAVGPRPLRILVTLDWLENPAGLRLMRSACQLARWPIVARSDSQVWRRGHATQARVAPAARRQLLAATRECVGLLRGGEFLLVFPEGYPNIDPGFTPKVDDGAFLPFEPGFLRVVALAEQDGITHVPIVPVGLEYQRRNRWHVTVRFGHPVWRAPDVASRAQIAAIEEQVRRLSGLVCAPGADKAKSDVPAVEART